MVGPPTQGTSQAKLLAICQRHEATTQAHWPPQKPRAAANAQSQAQKQSRAALHQQVFGQNCADEQGEGACKCSWACICSDQAFRGAVRPAGQSSSPSLRRPPQVSSCSIREAGQKRPAGLRRPATPCTHSPDTKTSKTPQAVQGDRGLPWAPAWPWQPGTSAPFGRWPPRCERHAARPCQSGS